MNNCSVAASMNYRVLGCFRPGYKRLMLAANNDGNVRKLIAESAPNGREFSAYEIDSAVQVILAIIDQKNGVV